MARKAGLNDSEAQDVVQETMVAVVRHMPGFKYDAANGQFKTWLLNMTRWRIIDHMRKRARTPQNEPEMLHEGETQSGGAMSIVDPSGNTRDALWEAEWMKTLYDAALAAIRRRIEAQTCQLFDFYVNKEWLPAKVASTFNVSEAQVYLAKHRITEMLKQEVARLDREGL